jgi:hypothetical protein
MNREKDTTFNDRKTQRIDTQRYLALAKKEAADKKARLEIDEATLKKETIHCKIVGLSERYNTLSDVTKLLSGGYASTEVNSDQTKNLRQAVRPNNPRFTKWDQFLRSFVNDVSKICVLTKFLENFITQNSHDNQMLRANLQTIKHKLEADIITLTVDTVMINTLIVKKYLMCWYVLNEYVNWMSKDSDAKS